MTADLRGFQYGLEALRRRRHWQLEAAQVELGAAQRAVQEAEALAEELSRAYERQREALARAQVRRPDPAALQAGVRWLASRRRAMADAELAAVEARARRAEAADRCVMLQREVDAVERHREGCLAEYVRDAEARLASDADKEWLARAHWLRQAPPDRGGEAA